MGATTFVLYSKMTCVTRLVLITFVGFDTICPLGKRQLHLCHTVKGLATIEAICNRAYNPNQPSICLELDSLHCTIYCKSTQSGCFNNHVEHTHDLVLLLLIDVVDIKLFSNLSLLFCSCILGLDPFMFDKTLLHAKENIW